MRICILTQPLDKNYGGLLQAYALQRILRDMGHEATTLRLKPLYAQSSSQAELYWKTFRRFLSRLKGNKNIVFCNPDAEWQYNRQRNPSLERFIDGKLNCLEANIPLDARKLPAFDAYIVGSDQVWRPVFSPRLTNFYLDFLGDQPVRRIAYAASFGVDTWEATEKLTERIRPLAHRFDRISVRETSAVDLCRDHLGVDADLMPDPTLLLTRDDYLAYVADTPDIPVSSRPYIATYFIDPNNSKATLVSDFARKHNLPVINVRQFDWTSGIDPAAHWIAGMANADYILTDSFHGTVFSLLFRKDFITFDNGWRGSSRFHTLLEAFGLRDRLVKADNVSEVIIPPVDPEAVSRQLTFQRDRGISFLAGALAPRN